MTIIPPPKPKPDKAFKRFCDDLRCPLCGSQLDGNVSISDANIYCCQNGDEYNAKYLIYQDRPEWEKLVYWYYPHEYRIVATKRGDVFYTTIGRYDMDYLPRFRSQTCKVMFEMTGTRLTFFRKRMEEKEFLKKLRLYSVFS